MKILQSILLLLVLLPFNSYADPSISNGFFVQKKTFSFTKTVKKQKCSGIVPYPYLSNSDEELFMSLNHEIKSFARNYSICNKGHKRYYSVKFAIPESGGKDFFSILWKTKKHGKVWRIDTMNFNAENATLLTPDHIFHVHSNNLMHEIVKLSQGHLNPEATWDEFLGKIESRDIQLYLKNGDWYIIFNSTPVFNKFFEFKIPKYFLKHRTKYDK